MKSHQKGFALVMVLFLMFSMLSAAAIIIWLVSNHARHVQHTINRTKATYLAEAGMQWGYWRLQNYEYELVSPGITNISWVAPVAASEKPASLAAYLGGDAAQADFSALGSPHTSTYYALDEAWKWDFTTPPGSVTAYKTVRVKLYRLDSTLPSGSEPPSPYAITASADY